MAEIISSIIVDPILSRIEEKVVSLIHEEFVAIHGVKEEVEKLSSNLTAIQAVLEDAEQRRLDGPGNKSLRDWLAKLRNAAYDGQDIVETFATETTLWNKKHKVGKFPTPLRLISKASYKSSVAHKIKEFSAKLDLIAKERHNFHLHVSSEGGSGRAQNFLVPTTYFVDTSDVFGRESDRDRLMHLLLSNEFDNGSDISVVPIVGMGGLGKTTLAQLVFNDKRVKEHFEFRMWACVTVEFDLRRILKDMIEYHTEMKYSNDLSTNILISRFLEFVAGKDFLLVLDDVWTENYQEWEQLQSILKQGGKASRVLLTTRSAKVCDTVGGTIPPHRLECLPEDECFSLFKKIAFKGSNALDGTLRKELEEIGGKIVGKCQGLPLAVKAMAGLLRGNIDANKWNQILGDSIWELDKEGKSNRPQILPALKLSYYHLPSYLKQCYAYCSIFPKAYVFDRKELVKFWMAEAFIQSGGQKSMEETGIEYFDELSMRSFFQVLNIRDKERYRMHDLIHDLAVSVSSPMCYQVKDNQSFTFCVESRHISSWLGPHVKAPTLQIIENSKKLRTLILHELPSSIEKLKLLRYLDLSRTELKVLPDSICNLCNLQTLKLLGCAWLFQLPDGLSKLENLHYLELDEMFWSKCRLLPPKIGNLISLQNLHAFPVHRVTGGHGIEELKNMANLTGTLHISNLENAVNAADSKLKEKQSLQKLVLEWSDDKGIINQQVEDRAARNIEDLQPPSNLEELALHRFKGSKFPLWMTADGLLQKLVTLTLIHCNKSTTLTVGQLPCLRNLRIKGMEELEEWPEDDQCLSLIKLQISNCPKLTTLPDWMPRLITLKIKKCGLLKALPRAPGIMSLILIDNHVLENWQEGMCIAEDSQGNRHPWHSFMGLLELKVKNCPNIQALPRYFDPQKLEISGCELITALQVPEISKHLQTLALDNCSSERLVRAIPSYNFLYSLSISKISNLISFPKFLNLPRLKSLYISNCQDLTSLSEEGSLKTLSSLWFLSVRSCSKLESLPDEGLPDGLQCLVIGSCPILKSLGSKNTLKSLPSLKDLYLEECPLLQLFPEDGLPSSLLHLEIHECPLLIEECRKKNVGTEWPKITHVRDQEIDDDDLIKQPSDPTLPNRKRRRYWTPWL
ncbi:Disease resistance protein [Corchorus capsularis]|uniref:Disease resistance protein n=1 Tax=Corchorus capsularis TaxID=210143 RepID=A0A1R3JJ90_COCAP|nr:Disease resistance protein [Corchorus capsularis]